MSAVKKLIIGLAAGAILGILYAPAKGSKTRRRLSRTGNMLRSRLKNIKTGIHNRIESLKEHHDDYAFQEI